MPTPNPSASGADLGIDTITVIGKTDGGFGDDLQSMVKQQEEERKKKLMKLGGTISLAAQALLGNNTGGFGV